MQQFMNDPDDIEWLFSTHLKGRAGKSLQGAKSFVLYGNEDSPDMLHVYASKNPTIHSPYYLVRFTHGKWRDTTLVDPSRKGGLGGAGYGKTHSNPRQVRTHKALGGLGHRDMRATIILAVWVDNWTGTNEQLERELADMAENMATYGVRVGPADSIVVHEAELSKNVD